MREYLVRRLITMVITLLVTATAIFAVLRVLPGDPVALILGTDFDPAVAARLRERLGLDRPLLVQYWEWLSRVVRGDWGVSLRYDRPVAALILQRLPVTLSLAAGALLLGATLALLFGTRAATHRGGLVDYGSLLLAQLGMAVPSFWLGLLLMLGLGLGLGWFRPGGFPGWEAPGEALRALVLPIVTLGVARAAALTRMLRSSMLETLGQEYVRTARGKGLDERRVIYRHVLKNAAIPVVTLLGLQLAELLGGSIVVEQVFAVPGIGRLLLYGIEARDLPVVQGVSLFLTGVVVLSNWAVDLAYALLDPRIRYG